ncbi:MAG: AAA family ATPase [Deltaproteobacteria bacterium]|nr:AAA family ATPase [Deltaproteobacteria bacterium]
MAIINEILEWASSRPNWQRDALRRIVIGETIDQKAINELMLIIGNEYNFISDDAIFPPIRPLEESHFLSCDDNCADVVLNGISEVKNINALAGTDPIEFNPSGLTIIYGGNGSGKSGYVRILKKICACRDVPRKILPNIYSSEQTIKQKAKIHFKTGETDSEFSWKGDNESLPELKSIQVFDSKSGSIFVTEENNLAFSPFGLGVFKTLAELCGEIKREIESKIVQGLSQIPQMGIDIQQSEAGIWLSKLTHRTKQEEVDSWVQFADQDKQTLLNVKEKLQKDPEKKANELKAKADRCETHLFSYLSKCDKFESKEIEKLRKLKEKMESTEKAYKLASNVAFKDRTKYPVIGVGEGEWRALWESAKQFSIHTAFPGKQFPGDEAIDRCVLCHQILIPDAKQRFSDFEKFVKDDTSEKFSEAAAGFDMAADEYEKFNNIDTKPIDLALEELKKDNSQLASEIESFLFEVQACHTSVASSLKEKKWEITPIKLTSPKTKVSGYIETLRKTSVEFKAASNPEEKERLQKQKLNLEGKKWLSENKNKIEEEVIRLKKRNALGNAKRSTNPRQITDKSTEMVDKYVGQEMYRTFEEWVNVLSPHKFKVALDTRGDHAVTYHSLKLVNSNDSTASVADIASEGEHKALALAAFLTEVSTFPHKSCLVFDDPVCSLDHIYRKRVADTFAKLAKERQIIVFTHDIYFLLSLVEASKKHEVNRKMFQLLSNSKGTGIYDDNIPFNAKPVNSKIKEINKIIQEAKRVEKETGESANLHYSDRLLNKFRITIERVVEEVYVNDVVARYKWNVTTKGKIGQIGKISPEDCIFIDDMMDKYSTPLHDPGTETPPPPPELEEIETDLLNLKRKVSEIRGR